MQSRYLTRYNAVLAGLVLLLFGSVAVAQENIGTISEPLTMTTDATDWTSLDNEVPVCWETNGYEREKRITQEAVAGTWEFWANVRFAGWGSCPQTGTAQHVRIRIHPQDTSNAGAGGSAVVGTAALSIAADNSPGVNLSFNPDGSADEGRVEYIAVHEFGHVLGFIHEQDAPGNEGPAKCNSGIDSDANPVPVTGYDRDSIMNYCNRDGNMTGNLTDVDIAGIQRIYGARRPHIASWNACASAAGADMASLAAPWNNENATTIAIFPSDSTRFLYHAQWNIRDGGWADNIKWASGDFNGDGLNDLAASWNYGGNTVLTVRTSDGTKFIPVHWLENAGGWQDNTVWMPGDFNGDGLTDLAAAWNNGGRASIAVYPSDGTKFLYWSQWADRDGGWADTIRWLAGDFNGDGKTDVGAAWNNGGRITLTVRLSQGDKFIPVHWLVDAGHWSDSTTFLAGDFDGDGRDDIAQMWNDVGRNSINVSRSTGTRFAAPVNWSRRDGGWGNQIKWIPGDFNGDGLVDIAAAWNNRGTNTLTVRTSDGHRFVPAHWSTNAGGWIDSTVWCAGKFQ